MLSPPAVPHLVGARLGVWHATNKCVGALLILKEHECWGSAVGLRHDAPRVDEIDRGTEPISGPEACRVLQRERVATESTVVRGIDKWRIFESDHVVRAREKEGRRESRPAIGRRAGDRRCGIVSQDARLEALTAYVPSLSTLMYSVDSDVFPLALHVVFTCAAAPHAMTSNPPSTGGRAPSGAEMNSVSILPTKTCSDQISVQFTFTVSRTQARQGKARQGKQGSVIRARVPCASTQSVASRVGFPHPPVSPRSSPPVVLTN